jgi:hypothetical protein
MLAGKGKEVRMYWKKDLEIMDTHFFAELNEAGAGAALFRSSSTLGIQFFLKKESNRVTLASTWVPITSIQGDRSLKKIYFPSYLIQIYRRGIQI